MAASTELIGTITAFATTIGNIYLFIKAGDTTDKLIDGLNKHAVQYKSIVEELSARFEHSQVQQDRLVEALQGRPRRAR